MPWQVVVALMVIIPIILFPAAFVWYLNIGGLYATIKEARKARAEQKAKIAQEEGTEVLVKVK